MGSTYVGTPRAQLRSHAAHIPHHTHQAAHPVAALHLSQQSCGEMFPELKPPDKSPPLKQTPATSVQLAAAKAGWAAKRSTPDAAAAISHSNCPPSLPICIAVPVRLLPEGTKLQPKTDQVGGLRPTALLPFHRSCWAT